MKRIVIIISMVVISLEGNTQEIKRIKITELERTIAESKTPLIVNFWATFCIPCIEEIPYFQQEVRKHAKDSIQLILVSLDLTKDYPKVGPFAIKRKFTAPIMWLDETDADYFCPKIDSTWSGGIPASLFINNKKGYRHFVEEKLSLEKLQKEIERSIQ